MPQQLTDEQVITRALLLYAKAQEDRPEAAPRMPYRAEYLRRAERARLLMVEYQRSLQGRRRA